MKRFMKQDKINFFESPLPCQIKPQLFIQSPRRNWQAWHDCHQDQLFGTPLKHLNSTEQWIIDQENMMKGEDIEQESQSRGIEYMQQNQSMLPEINRKISFSDQESQQADMLELTPVKQKVYQNQSEMPQTAQKKYTNENTPVNESKMSHPQSKLCQRGLKKLASEAYLFVSSQKRTTYKDVARKLINQLCDDGDLQLQKRGQLNVKRRVYDALNVLLALGLLKRNGNKIVGRKGDETLMIGRRCLQKHNTNFDTKDEDALEERDSLAKEIQLKQTLVKEKKKLLQTLHKKVSSLKQLQNRNKSGHATKNIIKLPFLILYPQRQGQPESELRIWEQPNQLNLTFPSSSLNLSGDLDILSQVKLERSRRKSKR